MKKKKRNKIVYIVSVIVTIISFIVLMAFSYTLLNLNMIPNKYLILFFLIISIFYSLLYLLTLIPNIKVVFKIIACLLLIVFSCGFQFGIRYVDVTIRFVDKINDNLFQNEEYYLITLENSQMVDVSSANGKIIGFYKNNSVNTESAVNSLKEKIAFTEEDYDDVVTMFEQLDDYKVDALLINASTKNLLEEDLSYLNVKIKELGTILVPIKTVDIVKVVDVTNTPFNIYIAGGDSYGTIDKVTNTDVNIIITVDAKNHKLLLTSIPRDYYVHLSGMGEDAYDKLTHAGYYGIETSVKSIEELLDIEINYYAKVNFSTVVDLIDIIGGITVYNDFEFCIPFDIPECYEQGNIDLTGARALMYARERMIFEGGDRMRQYHQQQVLTAIINKITSSTVLISKYSDILNSLEGVFQTNIDSKSISKLIKFQLSDMKGWEIDSYSLNGTDFYTKNTFTFPNSKLYVMKPNVDTIEEAKQKIKQIINNR